MKSDEQKEQSLQIPIFLLTVFFAILLFFGGAYGIKWYLKEKKFNKYLNEYIEEEVENALTEATEDLSFLPPEGVTINKGTESSGSCFRERENACSAARKMVPKKQCADKIQLVASKPLKCDCDVNPRCGEGYPWVCSVSWEFICDINAECAKHSDCPSKDWLCRERRCVQFE